VFPTITFEGWECVVNVTLPLPPSINHYYKRKRNGGVYLSVDAIKFRIETQIICASIKQIESSVIVHSIWHPINKRSYDVDNRLKSLNDSLTHAGVWDDDKQVIRCIADKGDIVKGGACEVFIYVEKLS